ncbi:MAG: cytochrome c3 family protein, partial [Betaproteobacteria bacterium]|nr:cytochrome c3 family protein [Betaproteobacteria bacterium]
MDLYRTARFVQRALLCNSLVIASIAALALLTASAPTYAADEALSAADQNCLGCHGSAGMEKKLADGEVLQLQVPADMFRKSVHRPNGCVSCHTDVDPTAHPPSKKEIKTKRSYAIAATESCKGCHTDKVEQWDRSIHAALARKGDPSAPICADCHNPHATIKGAGTKIDETPCQNCHKDIFTAYLGSVHGKLRSGSADSYAPVCSGCHNSHEVKPISLGEGPAAACSGCHAGVLEKHKVWLPNAGLHFEAVSCPACHAPTAHRKVDLMLIDSQAKALGTEQIGVPLFDASARSDGKGIDALTLWNLLQTFNRDGLTCRTVVRGRLKVSTGPQAHELADKSKAISDCHTCHRQGSEAFESVTISLVGPDGRRVGYGASADVLSSPISLDSVSGFYAIGGTRIILLDILL